MGPALLARRPPLSLVRPLGLVLRSLAGPSQAFSVLSLLPKFEDSSSVFLSMYDSDPNHYGLHILSHRLKCHKSSP